MVLVRISFSRQETAHQTKAAMCLYHQALVRQCDLVLFRLYRVHQQFHRVMFQFHPVGLAKEKAVQWAFPPAALQVVFQARYH
jgi:hypothetical protein